MNPRNDKRVAVLYATREGQTRKVAEHVAASMRAMGLAVDVMNVKELPDDFALASYAGAILAASIHMGHHEREMIAFTKARRPELEALPTAFLSVSMAEADAAHAATPEQRAIAAENVKKQTETFFTETGWKPNEVHPVAGALLYRQYGFITRLMMRMIAKKTGSETDTSRDHEYTDWEALDRFAHEMSARVGHT